MAYQIILRQVKSGLPLFFGGILGVIYAIVLWFFAQGILLPGTGSSVGEILPGQFAVAHIIYGAILGFLTSKSQQ
jgi:hypothetical protein